MTELPNGDFRLLSSYNQPLFIGKSHPQPGEIYVRLHEMMARIFKMRGQAGYYEYDSDSEDDIYVLESFPKVHMNLKQDSVLTVNNVE